MTDWHTKRVREPRIARVKKLGNVIAIERKSSNGDLQMWRMILGALIVPSTMLGEPAHAQSCAQIKARMESIARSMNQIDRAGDYAKLAELERLDAQYRRCHGTSGSTAVAPPPRYSPDNPPPGSIPGTRRDTTVEQLRREGNTICPMQVNGTFSACPRGMACKPGGGCMKVPARAP